NRFDDVASSTRLSSEERKHIVYFENAQYNIMVGGAGQFLEPSNPPGGDYIGAADNLQNVVLYPATGLSSRLPRTSTSPGLEFQFCPGGTAADGDSRIIRWTNQGSGVIDLDFESL
ncbi:MAG TPA: hypothetical protein VHE30_22560, partial [Polyangiaceae bacterium]|nr:hypothetical protein [Polyangiaceae bacterium]